MKHPEVSGGGVARNDGGFTAADDEVVQVPHGAAAFAEALEHRGEGTFVADIQDWDEPANLDRPHGDAPDESGWEPA
jgi:hypothetical protein